jgi:protein-arginine kinase activator protein McsA
MPNQRTCSRPADQTASADPGPRLPPNVYRKVSGYSVKAKSHGVEHCLGTFPTLAQAIDALARFRSEHPYAHKITMPKIVPRDKRAARWIACSACSTVFQAIPSRIMLCLACYTTSGEHITSEVYRDNFSAHDDD